MLPNLYYRSGVEELGSVVGEANIATRQAALGLMATIHIPMVMQDTEALTAFALKSGRIQGPMGAVALHER